LLLYFFCQPLLLSFLPLLGFSLPLRFLLFPKPFLTGTRHPPLILSVTILYHESLSGFLVLDLHDIMAVEPMAEFWLGRAKFVHENDLLF